MVLLPGYLATAPVGRSWLAIAGSAGVPSKSSSWEIAVSPIVPSVSTA